MATDPDMMQQMLMQQLMQPAQGGSFGGGAAGPQMQGNISPLNAAATLAQKAMLIRALQAPQIQQQQANAMLPKTNAMISQDPSMQALQRPPQMPPMQMPDPTIAAPFAQPTPGFS